MEITLHLSEKIPNKERNYERQNNFNFLVHFQDKLENKDFL